MARLLALAKALLVVGALTAALVLGYLVHVDRTITQTFEGRRWSVPAQVFAQPQELYVGARVGLGDVRQELARLGYSETPDLSTPGTFSVIGDELRTHLRPFVFSDGYRSARELTIGFAGGAITRLAANGADTALVRLEPLPIGSFFASHGEDRVVLTPDAVPPLLREGLKAVEDRSFEAHMGFSIRGIARALLVNLRAGERQQGGSTLTQQLVKSYFLDNSRTISRKLRELAMAVILEARFDKDDLLNAYINEIYLAQDGARAIHGFGLGSQFYFNKPLKELAPHETALLLTVIRGPSYYNPYRHPDRARERRDRILGQLRDDALIGERAYQAGIAAPLGLAGRARRRGAYYPAFMDLVRQELAAEYPVAALASEGLRIFTTLRPDLQDRLQDSANDTLAAISPDTNLQAAAMVTNSQTGEVLALLGGRGSGRGGYNRALKALRPAGSLLKPIVYLTALESGGFHLASLLRDEPITIDLPNGDAWSPRNFDETTHGEVPLVRGLADSLNLATVQLGLQVGLPNIAERIRDLLPGSSPRPYPALILGAHDMNVVQVGELYSSVANSGFYAPPRAVLAVQNETGEAVERYPLQTRQTIAADDLAALVRGLDIAMSHGTGRSSPLARSGVAGKTGTSNDFRDSWFVGFDGALLTSVWIGNDDNTPTRLTGASGALKIWSAFMAGVGVTPLVEGAAPNLVEQQVDFATGLRADARCGSLVALPLPDDTRIAPHPECQPERGLGDRLRRWFRRS
ncbi:MAG: transglycosylase domain-containing protein [Pseudomonadota bacterium]